MDEYSTIEVKLASEQFYSKNKVFRSQYSIRLKEKLYISKPVFNNYNVQPFLITGILNFFPEIKVREAVDMVP